jgi:serine protease Do
MIFFGYTLFVRFDFREVKEDSMYKLQIGKILGAATVAGACLLTFGAAAFAQGTAEAVAVEAAEVNTEEPGVLIVSVQSDSPAATAGLKRGDIVLEVDGAPVNSSEELRAALVAMKPGDEVTLSVQHGDEQKEVAVALGDRNGQPFLGIVPHGPLGPGVIVSRPAGAAPGAGVRIMPFSGMPAGPPEMMQISSTIGVRVLEVLPDSPAAAAGLQAGYQIVAVDGKPLPPGVALAAML